MSVATAGHAPSTRDLRRWIARARGGHHDRSREEIFNDLYMLLWIFGVYGGVLVHALRDYVGLAGGPVGDTGAARYWLGLALLSGALGVGWNVLRAVGPVVVGAAEQAWVLSTPVDRRRWLTPRFIGTALAVVGAGTALSLATALVVTGDGMAWALAAGMGIGATSVGAAVVAQEAGSGARWPRVPGPALLGIAALGAALLVVPEVTGGRLPPPPSAPLRALGAIAVPVGLLALVGAVRALPRLSRAALGRGAGLLGAVTTAAVAIDPSILTRVAAVRRWRAVGRVSSRPFRPFLGGRVGVLLAAELRRLTRRPGAVGVIGGLALAQVALAVAFPALGPSVRILAAYVVGLQLSIGLRTVAGSPGLRRALGGREWTVRATHLVVPAVGILLWWVATELAGGGTGSVAGYGLIPVIVSATYRGAARPPMRYDGLVLETPFGPFPVDLMRQLIRGPDLLGGALVAQFLLQA